MNEKADQSEEAGSEANPADAETTEAKISELDSLIGELKDKVGSLREGELDAAALEARLRELTDLASRAASTLDSVSR